MRSAFPLVVLVLASCEQAPARPLDAAPSDLVAPPPGFAVGGTVVGLLGGSATLTNGGESLRVWANGPFQFAARLASGDAFDVTVAAQPTAPAQRCSVAAGRGTVDRAPVSSVVVNCDAETFTLGGVAVGLAGAPVVLQDFGLPDLTVAADGAFAFAAPVTRGTTYRVTVKQQPAGGSCRVAGGIGAVVGEVTTVVVDCRADRFTIGGTVSGLRGRGLVLENKGGDDTSIGGQGAFAFPTPVAAGSGYAVTVTRAPSRPSQTCTVASATGIATGDVTSVAITCANDATDWPQFNYDAQHDGSNLQESTIEPGNVAQLAIKKSITLPAIADGAPAFLRAQPGATTQDLLFLTTKDGTLLALDAATLATVWATQPAATPRFTTSSPAIDPGRRFVYSYGLDGKVHQFAVASGAETTTAAWPEVATIKPDVEKGSSALTITDAHLYVASSGYPGDAGDYQGHVTAIALPTGTQQVFNSLCSDERVHLLAVPAVPSCTSWQSGVWARSGVSYHQELDRIFFATGNGPFDGVRQWGDTVLALTADGSSLVDSYTPIEFQNLSDIDADLGSVAPALLPTPPHSRYLHLAVQGGKDGELRLLDLDDLSRMSKLGATGGELQKLAVPQGNGVLPAIAVWVDPADGSDWIFVATQNGLSGLQVLVDATGNPSLTMRWILNGYGGTSPVIANGVLFYATYAGLLAMRPTDGSQLWIDATVKHLHWESPIVVNGRLYLTDEDAKLTMFGL